MKLNKLLNETEYSGYDFPKDLDIKNIVYDSRLVNNQSCFIAIKGEKFNGHNFIFEALKRGAKIIIVDEDRFLDKRSPIIKVDNTRKVLSNMSSNFFGNPSKFMSLVGVTGTNGKTTVVQIVKALLNSFGNKCGTIGTLGFSLDDNILSTKLTTPESLELHGMLKSLSDNEINYNALEVSSHSLNQNRVDDVDFNVTIFTNLTHDHLDYHKTMDNYFNAKLKLFADLGSNSTSVINIDDSFGRQIFKSINSSKISYGLSQKADISASNISSTLDRTELCVKILGEDFKIKTNLIGDYNVLNIMASLGALISLGFKASDIVGKINSLELLVPGRMELVAKNKEQYVYIDYAHTPDSYSKIFENIKSINKGYKLIALFGCGGDRDISKRSMMGAISEEYCDSIFITSDNPRNEPLDSIICDIVKGMKANKHKIIEDRKEAIEGAINSMDEKSILFVLGKGREEYQEINDEKIFFSDVDIIKNYIYAN
ncbi:MAG: UDP-N-acetylmuramoyl-L-alanyl-D-glutamate--2,6-diaminopimelate ligase [Candidatus Marinimicrobia bacterium]|nr:UDP-N-acetylmuramoyl-L-alanyl-D-glutamate--2,6-diaminopimelate ligase [Candidatus Neomarinimicrobiota bacterium]|tara:strand:- start:5327 stop:6781 length:1455 start_codon:yes stop_codon:yes gene_type:complete